MAILLPRWEKPRRWIDAPSLDRLLVPYSAPYAFALESNLSNFGDSSAAATYTDVGAGGYFNGSSSNVSLSAETLGIGGSNSYILLAQITPMTLSGIQGLIWKDYSLDGVRVFQFRLNSSGLDFIRFDSGDSVVTNITGGSLTVGQRHTVVAVFSNNESESAIYVDGVKVASQSSGTDNGDPGGSTPTLIGCGYTGAGSTKTYFFNGVMHFAGLISGGDLGLAHELSIDPYKILNPSRSYWVMPEVVGAGGSLFVRAAGEGGLAGYGGLAGRGGLAG